ncbi:DUF2972 domain-containing protein, partial [Campylobacter sp. TTU_617]|uniref:DUF2972 domain-containing protein n=1 Tax=Campylobacter sp. TTU_617 TaxID=2768148 RepID=UPI0019041018
NFNYYSNIKAFLESKKEFKIFYIDCKELDSKIAFDTMNKLAKTLDFNPPNIKDKEKFEHKLWNKFAHLLPFNLLLEKKTFPYLLKNIELSIIEKAKLFNTPPPICSIDIKSFILDKDYIYYENLGIYIDENDFKILKEHKELFEEVKNYLLKFSIFLKEQIEFKEANFINEKDILNYLKENKDLRIYLKNILDYELTHIKEHRPDIIASWKYYQEFEKMC